MSLFKYIPHKHEPINTNEQYNKEKQGINDVLAEAITKAFGTMWAFYILVLWMVLWMLLAGLDFWLFKYDHYPYPFLLFCSNLIQLWALPVLAVGQRVIGRKQELQGNEQFNFTEKSYHNIEQVMQHLDAQDNEIIQIKALLLQIAQDKQK